MREREREIYEKETREIKAELEKESKIREERVSQFLEKQTEELNNLLMNQKAHDPERILEIKQKK